LSLKFTEYLDDLGGFSENFYGKKSNFFIDISSGMGKGVGLTNLFVFVTRKIAIKPQSTKKLVKFLRRRLTSLEDYNSVNKFPVGN